MNINDYKYIVSTGCSYGKIISSILDKQESSLNQYDELFKKELEGSKIKKYKTNYKNIVYIDVPMPSQGTGWQSDSIIYITHQLLDIGIKPSNIYALVEWSQWSRTNYTVPIAFHNTLNIKSFKKRFNKIGSSKCEDFLIKSSSEVITKLIHNTLDLKTYKDVGINFTSINDEYYISPLHTSKQGIKQVLGTEWDYFIETLINSEDEKSIDEKVKEYLNNIIKTQNHLKLNNINYNFFHMQGCMIGWYLDGGVIKHNLTHEPDYNPFTYDGKRTKQNINYNINSSNSSELSNVWKKYSWLYNQIDFDNIWYYNNNGYRFGGIDEYSLSKYGETSYTSVYDRTLEAIKGKEDATLIQPARFGRHPAVIIYKTLWNDVTSNCDFLKFSDEYLELLDKKLFEDINSDNLTQNGLLFSKKEYWNFYTKQ